MYDIVAIGNAICDILVKVSDNQLDKSGVIKGSMELCDKDSIDTFISKLDEDGLKYTISSGGSAANTSFIINQYDINTAFVGNVSECNLGKIFSQDLEENFIDFYNCKNSNGEETAKSVILITDDGQRSMKTYLGCAPQISLNDDEVEKIIQTKYLYIEGYLWDNQKSVESISNIIIKARSQGVKIAFSLSDLFCVERHLDKFNKLINNEVDIVFGNEGEFLKLFNLEQIDNNSLNIIQNTMKKNNVLLYVITMEEKGCIVVSENDIEIVNTKIIKPIDTTGAGDSFAAGFLYGLIKKMPIREIAKIANDKSGEVIMHIGARISSDNTKKEIFA